MKADRPSPPPAVFTMIGADGTEVGRFERPRDALLRLGEVIRLAGVQYRIKSVLPRRVVMVEDVEAAAPVGAHQ